MNISFKVLVIVFLTFFASITFATIINIPDDQPTIQAGINVAVNGDTVLVHPGTYFENINYNGKNITVASLFLTTQDTTYISQTIIDGDSIDSVVTFESGEDSTAVLCGFTITNGYSETGGGICCWDNSNPSIKNITITNSICEYNGGGFFCFNSNPSLINVKILNNSTIEDFFNSGGGIWCHGSNPLLENVIISGNFAAGYGGGIFCHVSNPILENVTISNNISLYGGGIYCIFDSDLTLLNITITNNHASNKGGGIYCHNDCSPSLVNVTIAGNSADYGGGIWSGNNCNPSLVNCILWNDLPDEIYFWEEGNPNSITISYSDIQGGEAGIVTNNNGTVNWLEGNIDEDPLFVGTGGHPYSLMEGSPCIDAGIPDTTGLNLPPWDIIGNLRIWDGDGNGTAIIDMGAYEFGAPPYVITDENTILEIPEIHLYQNYPNPFNPAVAGAGRSPATTISFQIPENGEVNLSIYNIKGQKIKTIVNEKLEQGLHQIIWDGKNDNNQYVASGVYFYKLKVNNKNIAIKKCLLLK